MSRVRVILYSYQSSVTNGNRFALRRTTQPTKRVRKLGEDADLPVTLTIDEEIYSRPEVNCV